MASDGLERYILPHCDFTLQAYSKAADVFSFGVILWELITWQMPWEELGVFQVRRLLCLRWPTALHHRSCHFDALHTSHKREAVMHDAQSLRHGGAR